MNLSLWPAIPRGHRATAGWDPGAHPRHLGHILQRILDALGRSDIDILMISQSSSEADISLVIARQNLERAIIALRESLLREGFFREITSEADVSIVAAVGAGMKGTPGIAARLFRAVADKGVNVKMIAQGSSELNISFLVREDDLTKSVHTLHEEFQLGD